MRIRGILIMGLTLFSIGGVAAEKNGKRVIDLGEGEIFGDLKRPQIRWVDSSAAMREILPKIHARKFAELEAELLKPLDRAQWRKRLSRTGGER